jgi:DNA-binding response OmpR family regulator
MRILVIEDEERILSFVRRGLVAAGYAVDSAGDGRDGLDKALNGTCDLVVLDLMLPALSGMDVLQGVSANRPDLPVIVLSARSDLATKLKGFELGAVDYVATPFALDELLYQLLLHEGEIVSRERLLSEVWGYAFDPGSNVVEVCIRRLRQRLGPDVAIETVRNAGYRLAA